MELGPFNVDVVNATVGSFSSSLVDNAGTSQLKMRCAANLRFGCVLLQRLSGAVWSIGICWRCAAAKLATGSCQLAYAHAPQV